MLAKPQIIAALRTWVNQRPGLESADYGDWKAYRSELRQITKDRADALILLRAVELRDSIKAEDLIVAFPRAYSGRLQINAVPNAKGELCAYLEYCTGQYWPTEYRKAVCAVLAGVLWNYMRESMPAPKGKITRNSKFLGEVEHDSIDGLTPGDWLRRKFKQEFGRGIQSRWLN